MTRLRHIDKSGRYQVGQPDAVRAPQRRRGVATKDVACPECGAQPGDNCRRLDGSPIVNPADGKRAYTHRARQRMAARQVTATVDDRAAAFVDSLTPAERRAARKTRGLSRAAVSVVLGVSPYVFAALETGRRQTHDTTSAAYGALLRIWTTKGDA